MRCAAPSSCVHARNDEQQALRGTRAARSARSSAKFVGRALGLLELGLGRPVRGARSPARPDLDRAARVPPAGRARGPGRGRGRGPRRAARRCDRRPRPLPETGSSGSRTPRASSLLARCRALVDEPDAEPHFRRQAIELADALSPFDRARTELLYGEWLRRQHRRRRRPRPPPHRARGVRAARRGAVGRAGTGRAPRQRRDRAQARPLDARPAHPAGAADRAAWSPTGRPIPKSPRSCSSARARSTTTCARSSRSSRSPLAQSWRGPTSASP